LRASSTGNFQSSGERQRRKEFTQGLGGPEASDTFPPESPRTQQSRPIGEPKVSKEISEKSRGSTSNEPATGLKTVDDPINTDGQPRQRRTASTFTSFFKKDKEDPNTLETTRSWKSGENKQKFTFAGQLKATIFNSWINVLLLAAPAGSMLQVSFRYDPR
jgi:Ca2+:H+ antiporter